MGKKKYGRVGEKANWRVGGWRGEGDGWYAVVQNGWLNSKVNETTILKIIGVYHGKPQKNSVQGRPWEGDRGPHRRPEDTSLVEKPQQLSPITHRPPCLAWGAAPTSPWHSLRLWRPADLGHNEGVFALAAGKHDVVARVAEVGVGLARLALGPHAEPQAAAVTALLERDARSGPSLQAFPWPESPRDSRRAPRLTGGADKREQTPPPLVSSAQDVFSRDRSATCPQVLRLAQLVQVLCNNS